MRTSTVNRAVTCWFVVLVLVACIAGAAPLARAEKPPVVKAKAACVLDAETGAEIYSKSCDEIRPIASTTKIFVAMAVRKKGIDLDAWTTITRDDVRHAKGGARTRLDPGQEFRNLDLLRAMLMASDNRAPTALGRAVGWTPEELIKAMNGIAKDLGLKRTKFTDVSGLRGNVSTAREMALALHAALQDDVLRKVMGTDTIRVTSKSGYCKIDYSNTNQALHAHTHGVIGGKTGFTKAAGYCLVTGAKIGDREVTVAIYGAEGKAQRFAEFARLATWLEAGAEGSKLKVGAPGGPPRPSLRVEVRGKAKRK